MPDLAAPWQGAGLMFGRMFEDASIELELFANASRVFCIASAGCTALALAAAGHDVTAVDVNPAQVELVKARMAGAPTRPGSVDRSLARGMRAAGLLGWTERLRREFVTLDDVATQIRVWRDRFDTRRLRATLRILLSSLTLGLLYPLPVARAVPPDFDTIVRRRLARGFATHANRTNPYARWILLGEWPEQPPPAGRGRLDVLRAEAIDYLARASPRSFDAFTLSNIIDLADDDDAGRLRAAIERAAKPGATVVMRSFREPVDAASDRRAQRDRGLIWGSVSVDTL